MVEDRQLQAYKSGDRVFLHLILSGGLHDIKDLGLISCRILRIAPLIERAIPKRDLVRVPPGLFIFSLFHGFRGLGECQMAPQHFRDFQKPTFVPLEFTKTQKLNMLRF